MIFQGMPNQRVNLDSFKDLSFTFDDNGHFDTKSFMDKVEDDFINKLKIHFKEIEEKFTCKKCGEPFNNRGLFLAHCREHKKDGDD